MDHQTKRKTAGTMRATSPSSPQSIGRLARHTGVGIDTIRYYERIGLLPEPARSPSGYRVYADADRRRLQFIRRAQHLGFSLQEITRLLKLSARGGSVAQARAMAEEKLAAVRAKQAELERLHDALQSLVARCPGQGDPAQCPIIGALTTEPAPQKPRKARQT